MTADDTTTESTRREGVVTEFRINDVFCRVLEDPTPEDPDGVAFVFAGSAKGLDAPDALCPTRFWDLQNALNIASEAACLSLSSTGSEERTFNRECVRVGVLAMHDDPSCSPRAIPPEPTPPNDMAPADTPDEPFEVHFQVADLFGRVFGESRCDVAWMDFELATKRSDLGTKNAFQPASFRQILKAIEAASTLMDLSQKGVPAGKAAVGHRYLSQLGVEILSDD